MASRQSEYWTERFAPAIVPDRLGEVLAAAADLALVVAPDGRIRSVATNPDSPRLGHLDHWEGRDIRRFLAPDSVAKVTAQIASVSAGASNVAASIEVNHVDGAEWDAPVRYTLHPTGEDGDVLMLGRDLTALTELQQRLIRAQIALERDREAQRVHETRFRVLLEATTEGMVLLDAASGRVLDANAPAAAVLGLDLPALRGGSLASELEGRKRGELLDALSLAGASVDAEPVAARAARGGAPLLLHPRLFRGGGERTLLVRIAPAAGGEVPPDVQRARALFDHAPDAMVFADGDGAILDANAALLRLVDVERAADLRGRPLAEFLGRGLVDLRALLGEERPRLYDTHLVSVFGTRAGVEIAPLSTGDGGHAFVLREAVHAAPLAGLEKDGADPAVRHARAQVGTAPLRDIVASTTDVIERECIEAAIAFTENNRVAAAEMLGLSRQSLYVKLRKFGLLDRNEG